MSRSASHLLIIEFGPPLKRIVHDERHKQIEWRQDDEEEKFKYLYHTFNPSS